MDEALRNAAPDLHAQLPAGIWRDGWWVNIQPGGTGRQVVRYFGWMHPSARRRRLIVDVARSAEMAEPRFASRLSPGAKRKGELRGVPACGPRRAQTLLAVVIVVRPPAHAPPAWHLRCPHCEQFTLVCIGTIARSRACPEPVERAPPTCQP
jgi:hypothetical protein